MSIAAQYPARTDTNGRTWWRPVRPAGTDLSQWGWTSDPAQAHPDYDALNTCTCPWVDPSLWTTHYGAVEPGSTREHNPLCPVHPATLVELAVAREAPVVAAAAERAEAYGEAFGELFALAAAADRAEGDRILWGDPQREPGQLAEVRPLPGGGIAFVPTEPQTTEPLGELGDEWVHLGYVDETQGALW
ncbi:hypothetical protein PBI_TREYKAY_83 [Mycobacterium phage TreyKay]|uniref:Uncharacterized protein n=1 Tax=Mycobacterium phage Prithvi TaxID=2484215 RepID=A0A3G3M1X3_9CAUD|nr:hypothetical protein I5H05_gp20 [Mycobacterium phage Prithvi]ASZ75152.1 hypothetical protein PBI_TREYKAY_83 [Mycobacterium phage TreyKay]AYR00345.1 hypothetical protein PBI_PRITHVI_83 [Mycobacterium phage Prithvi]